MNPETIALVLRIRQLLEEPDIQKIYNCFDCFPLGCCNDASLLLGAILVEKGLGVYDYILASDEQGRTHSWLEDENYIVDITADQFPQVKETVVILRKSGIKKAYLGFKTTKRDKADFEALLGTHSLDLLRMYSTILRKF